nr:UDP-N-acetylglucosamine 2-epimerase (non-hydrolyzing) [Kordiimonas aquimaris]
MWKPACVRTIFIHRWPEEANRLITDNLSAYCFAPTAGSRDNLLKESISASKVHITGNTVIDALFMAKSRILNDKKLVNTYDTQFSFLDDDKKLVLVTGHRRESFGGGFENICTALTKIAERSDVEILYPVHLNPNVKGPVYQHLSGNENIHLIAPQDYPAFIYLMNRSHLILTDSGGVQEEAPSLGKPVLVMRDTTERPEAVDAGTAKLVGTNADIIVYETTKLLDDQGHYKNVAEAHNP